MSDDSENVHSHSNVRSPFSSSPFTSKSSATPLSVEPESTVSSREIQRECDLACKVLENPGSDWTDRVSALERLCRLAQDGACGNDEFLAYLVRLKEPLNLQIKDLRSSIVKEACHTISVIAKGFQMQSFGGGGSMKAPAGWSSLALSFVETCLKQTPVTIKVISESAEQCLRAIVECLAPFGSPKILSMFCSQASNKASQIRLAAVESLSVALMQWSNLGRSATAGKRWIEVRDALRAFLADSDEQVRKNARFCFWSFQHASKETADKLFATLDDATQRRVRDARPQNVDSGEKPLPINFPNKTASFHSRTKALTPLQGSSRSVLSNASSSSKLSLKAQPRDTDSTVSNSAQPQAMPSIVANAKHSKENNSANALVVGNAGGPTKVRAVRVQRNLDPSDKREYHPADYSDLAHGQHMNQGNATKKLGGARRVAGPQRVAARSSASKPSGPSTSSASAPRDSFSSRPLGGGALRVEFPAQNDNKPSSNASNSSSSQLPNGRPSTPQHQQHQQPLYSARTSTSTTGSLESYFHGSSGQPSSAELDRALADLESSHHWSTRVEAVKAIVEAQNSISSSTGAKMVPILCDRASDQHHRVAQEVLKAVNTFLPKFTKEFGENLKFLLPALLVGLSDSKASIKKLSNQALGLCMDNFSPDLLCSVLSGLCRRKGDKLRQGCVEFLTQVVPKSSSFFSNPSNVVQFAHRLEPCLRSKKMELRSASSALVETIFRFDQKAFVQALASADLSPNVSTLVVKVLVTRVKEFDKIRASISHEIEHTTTTSTTVKTKPTQEEDRDEEEEDRDPVATNEQESEQASDQASDQESEEDGDTISQEQASLSDEETYPDDMEECEGDVEQPEEDDEEEEEEDEFRDTDSEATVENSARLLEEQVVDSPPPLPPKGDHLKQPKTDATPPPVPPKSALLLSLSSGRKSTRTSTPSPAAFTLDNTTSSAGIEHQKTSLANFSAGSRHSLATPGRTSMGGVGSRLREDELDTVMTATIHALSFGSEEEVRQALKRVTSMCERPSTNMEPWIGQLVTGSVDKLSNSSSLLVREMSASLLGTMAKGFPEQMNASLEIVFGKLMDCFRGGKESFGVFRSVEAALNQMALSLDPVRVLSLSLEAILTDEDAVLLSGLGVLHRVVVRLPTPTVRQALPNLVPILTQTFGHRDPTVRRLTMFCFVELHFAVGELLTPYLGTLNLAQRKLVSMYIEREQEKRR